MRRTLAAAALGCLALLASAQDAPPAPPDPRPAVRALFQAMQKASAEWGDAKEGSEERLFKKFMAAYDRFGAEFAKTDWSVWDQPGDADLLARGVDHGAQAGFDARDFARARKGWEFLAERMPQNETAGRAVASGLAPVYGVTGDFEDGVPRLRRYIASLPPDATAPALTSLGDLLAAASDFDAAKKAYADALAACAQMDPRFPATRRLLEDSLKARSGVGEKVADISGADSATGKPAGLATLAAGKPAVCIVIAMSLFPNEQVVAAAKLLRHQPGRICVLGATSWDLLGPMTKIDTAVEVELPRSPTDEGGQPVKVTRENLRKHLETYRQRMKCGFPMVVAPDGALAGHAEWPYSAVLVLDAQRRLVRRAGALDSSGFEWVAEAVAVRHAAAAAGEGK